MAETHNARQRPDRTFRNLDCWVLSMELAEDTVRITRGWRAQDQFSLGLQLRRAAISIPSNIAEGYSRRSPAAARYHTAIALGSHGEYETQLELAKRCDLIDPDSFDRLSAECSKVGKLLSGLYRSAVRNVQRSHGG